MKFSVWSYFKRLPPDWRDEWQARADRGDPDAQISLAWEYAAGEYIDKDMEKAVALFRSAETKKPRHARLHLAKAKLLNKDMTFADDVAEDCQAGFGPALYFMGAAAHGAGNRAEALRYFIRASENGHLISEAFVWRLSRKTVLDWIFTFPYSVRLFARILVISLRDEHDIRVLQ